MTRVDICTIFIFLNSYLIKFILLSQAMSCDDINVSACLYMKNGITKNCYILSALLCVAMIKEV